MLGYFSSKNDQLIIKTVADSFYFVVINYLYTA